MALVTFCGYPSSGKSTRATQLAAFLSAKLAQPDIPPPLARLKLVLINDESLALDKSVYDDTRAEKPARATLFSAVQRHLNPDTIVVVDAMNYIKGSRYQMYCAAREVQTRTCTVFIATPPDRCKEWNATRTGSLAYAEPTLDNLISRFEEPSSSARWDSPLITVACDDPPLNERPPGAEDSALGSPEAERIWEAITQGELKPANVATQAVQTSSTSYLTLLESTTSLLVTSLLSAQSLSPLSGPTTLLLASSASSPGPEVRVTLSVTKPVSMPMLQRLKRQFTTLNARTGSELGRGAIADLFAQYLEGQLR
ncbi:hypothetical protein JCM1840_007068 [Sporobolomyces johnsonii]